VGGDVKLKKKHIVAISEKFATFLYQFQ